MMDADKNKEGNSADNPPERLKKPEILNTLNLIILYALGPFVSVTVVNVMTPHTTEGEIAFWGIAGISGLFLFSAVAIRMGLILFKYSNFSLMALLGTILWLGFWVTLMVINFDREQVFLSCAIGLLISVAILWFYTRQKEPR